MTAPTIILVARFGDNRSVAPTDVTFAFDGRVSCGRAAAAPEDVALSGELIADFAELTFERILAPSSAPRW